MENIPAFRAAVEGAEAEARIATQVELRKKNPAAWLGRSGNAGVPVLRPQMRGEKAHQLNLRQQRFCLEYVKDGNGTQAAIRAGYADKGAEVQAHHLLRNPKVLERIRTERDRLDGALNLSVERVLREYMRIAFLDPAQLYDAVGNLLPIKEMPADARRALSGIEVEEVYDFERGSKTQVATLRKVRFATKQGALDALAKHLGILKDRVEHSGPGGGPIPITALREEIFRLMGDGEAEEKK